MIYEQHYEGIDYSHQAYAISKFKDYMSFVISSKNDTFVNTYASTDPWSTHKVRMPDRRRLMTFREWRYKHNVHINADGIEAIRNDSNIQTYSQILGIKIPNYKIPCVMGVV